MAGRRWTAREDAYLRRYVGKRTFPELADHLVRSLSATYQRAHKLGLYVRGPYADYGDGFESFLRGRHALGHSSADIAAAWGGERHAVDNHRRRLGLPSNAYNARHKRKSSRTWFKKGAIRGNAARRYRAVGSTTTRAHGGKHRSGRKRKHRARFIKVRDDGPLARRYMPFARWLWEHQHGKLPAGCIVVHRDGDTLNDDLANLEAIPHRELPAWLKVWRPEAEARRRANAAKATARRHALNRARKARRLSEREPPGPRHHRKPERAADQYRDRKRAAQRERVA